MPNTDESPHHSAKQVRNDAGQWVSGDSFDGRLAALKSHISGLSGGGSDVAYRYGMLPLTEDSKGKLSLGLPQVAVDTGNAMARMGRALGNAFGAHNTDVMPTNQDAALIAGLAMTGGGFGSLASKAVSGRALEDVAAANGLRSSPVEAGSNIQGLLARREELERAISSTTRAPDGWHRALAETNDAITKSGGAPTAGPATTRLYHGTAGTFDQVDTPDFWASPDRATAQKYATLAARRTGKDPVVLPLDFTPSTNGVMPPTSRYASAGAMRDLALKNGYDAVNWGPFAPDGDYVQVVRRGTVKNALTGETLFSNPKEAAPVGMVAGFSQDSPFRHLAEMRAAKTGAPVTTRVYRGMSDQQSWPPEPADTGHNNSAFWASTDPDVSDTYARTRIAQGLGADPDMTPTIMPAEARFQNPMVVDANARAWNEIHPTALPDNWPGAFHAAHTTDELARVAREQGHDGLIVKNVFDALGGGDVLTHEPATTIAALRPGTVFSPLTGEQLFSNAPEAAAAGTVGMDRSKGDPFDTALAALHSFFNQPKASP